MKPGIVVLFALTVGLVQADDLAGHYILRNVHEMGSELVLRPDGTFDFMLAYGAADYHAKGTWKREQGWVILTSADKDDPPLRLLRSAASPGRGVRVYVRAPNGAPIEHIDVELHAASGTSKTRTTEQGAAFFPDARKVKEALLHVPVYDVDAGPFPLDAANNEFYFEINGEVITQAHFKDERLRVEGKTLILGHGGEAPMRYERQ